MEPFLGQISMFGFNFAPLGWAFCDGQLMPIAKNTALFSLLGTTYGGDGRNTFRLPDLRGRVAIHPGNGPGLSKYVQGQKGGQEQVTLNQNQIPSHSHTATAVMNTGKDRGLTDIPDGAVLAHEARGGQDALNIYTQSDNSKTMRGDAISVTVAPSGGNLPHENRQPFLGVYYSIALQGDFPSRS